MSKAQKYIALIRKEEGTDYWVDIPDIPGCVSRGATVDVAMANFQEALRFHLDGLKKDKQELPAPRGKDDVLESEDEEGFQAYLVEVSNDDNLRATFSVIS